MEQKQRIALLGSTGSIGRQTLEVVRACGDRFELTALAACNNWERLVTQAIAFGPDCVVIANRDHYSRVKEALAAHPIKVYAGSEAMEQVVQGGNVDVVVNALVGYAGLAPTVAALQAGKKVALANKESLVVAGEWVMRTAREHCAPVIPIDSEHSALFQCLVGESSPPEKMILTGSGGPFLHTSLAELGAVTVEQALRHPNWTMGDKITIDSATLMNKGFEVMEAHWLFGVEPSRIEVLIHPQSVIHSMVEFADGAVKAQLGTPDMRLPIQYALTFPQRRPLEGGRFDFSACGGLTFLPVNHEKFPTLRLAYRALERGGNSGCILNAANEVAVQAFLDREIGFLQITRVLEETFEKATFLPAPAFEEFGLCDAEARRIAREMIDRIKK